MTRGNEESAASGGPGPLDGVDPEGRIELLYERLRTGPDGLSEREAERRLVQFGPNAISRRERRSHLPELVRQFTHPLALLLAAAAVLAWIAGIVPVAIAIVVVIVINAAFAFAQELQAERAVEALAAFLPETATVIRGGRRATIDATGLVPGDLLIIEEGDRISADARLIEGALEIDMSTLTGESVAVERSSAPSSGASLLQARDLALSGTTCTEGRARGVVFATGMRTELGRIASLSERVSADESPLEIQVRKVARLIAVVAVAGAIAFIPVATLAADLPIADAVVFAVGLLVGLVPEALLPVITLALAAGARELAARGAIVKRLSAVETLGSTKVICTDKTGTLTENRMTATFAWTPGRSWNLAAHPHSSLSPAPELVALATVAAACNNASLAGPDGKAAGDPTEIACLEMAARAGADVDAEDRAAGRLREFHFDPELKLMTTIEAGADEDASSPLRRISTKGAPEAVLPRCTSIAGGDGTRPLGADARAEVDEAVTSFARRGYRVLAFATRVLDGPVPERREDAERDLCLLGLLAMADPPRPEVSDAVADCRRAGIRVVVITGDHGLTATAVARDVGIVTGEPVVVDGEELDRMSDEELDELLRTEDELIFARSSPEAKLRIAESLRSEGLVVAMTGDGVNDAPALRRADIGVAMGRSGTDVAREASAMVLTDDNFATIVAAVAAGRRVYDNVRKFIFYIFAHATPEVAPFLVFALGGGAIPLPLPVLQLLAFDVGTETLPALALGREPAEPGIMDRPPRDRSEGVISRGMLVRAWLFLGVICAALSLAGFFWVLLDAGWSPGDATGSGSPLHHAYLQATSMTFLGMVMGQVGTAFAARTERASLRTVGVFSNRLLLWGIAFALGLAALIIYFPPCQELFATAALEPHMVLLTLPFPFIVWGADEARRAWARRRAARTHRPRRGRRGIGSRAVSADSDQSGGDGVRPELAELRERKALLSDEARPEAVAKRHSSGRRTARENLADLVDPGSFVEYGGLAIAAQRARREVAELIERTPADGLIAGTARINGESFGEQAACAVLSYDYMVLAGTQGVFGHRKKDRLFDLIERLRLPTVIFAEGGGGRPGDTDYPVVSALDTRAFALWARISGLAPRIAIVAGRCFAGNAVLAGSADLIVATEDIALGMGGPAMVAGGGLGEFAPEEIGPIGVQSPNGVVDLRVADEPAAVDATKRLLGFFQGPLAEWEAPDPERARTVVPESRRRAYDVHRAIDAIVDAGTAVHLRDEFAKGMVTTLARIEGRAVGIVANNPMQMAGAITSDGADKAARFMQLCDAYGIPIISLIDTPGMMVGPEAEATALVRHCSRLFNTGANLRVPLVAVILRKAYGLGAQAMAGGGLHEPLLTVGWPTAELGAMGLEGAVRLGLRRELDAIADPDERERRVREVTEHAHEHAKALNAATIFELDDVVDPADTRRLIASTLAAASSAPRSPAAERRPVDAW